MPNPRGKNSVRLRSYGATRQPSRLQRRKLARRKQIAIQSRAISILGSARPQVISNQGHDPQAIPAAARVIEQSFGRETFLRNIVEACAANIAVLNESGKVLYVSKPWRLSGEDGRDPLDLNYLERRNRPYAGPSNHTSALAEDIKAILDGGIKEFHNEYSCPSPTGSRWFVVHAARLDLPGATGSFRVLVNSSDITHARQTEETLRDLGGRLITAQEEERSRVARELHDDLNQRMALLSVELEQLSQRLPASQKSLRSSINGVWERAQEISTEIHRVSYQLHPSKLDHLGLVAAVRSLCQEFAGHHEIKINFHETGCSGLFPRDITLCLFRIVQESFRNIIKHSGAREATVELEANPHVIQLSISDNGRGFDIGSAESKSGLGLISMRERLRLVSGFISIHSTSQGTKIEVSVPLNDSISRSPEFALPGPAQDSKFLSNCVSA